jgi:hypothetical protein
MRVTTKVRLAVGVALGVSLIALAGCGRFGGGGANALDGTQTSDLTWDQQALQSIGFTTDDVSTATLTADPTTPTTAPTAGATPAPAGSGKPRAKRILRHRLIRYAFGGGKALHGEATVQTDDGTKTVVVQRGTVTAVTPTSLTVKSTDGFSLTWTYGNPIKVIQNKVEVAPGTLAVGATVGVAGTRTGTATTASLVVVPKAK